MVGIHRYILSIEFSEFLREQIRCEMFAHAGEFNHRIWKGSPTRSGKGSGDNLTILEDHELRVDRDIAAVTVPHNALDGSADSAVGQPDHLRSVDLDLASAGFSRLGRD